MSVRRPNKHNAVFAASLVTSWKETAYMKFLHAADIHLDSPLKGLDQYEGAPVDEIRGATRRAFENLIETALLEAVDFCLIAGDLYDGDWRDYNTGLYMVDQMRQLREADIPVYIVAGNHDAQSRMTRNLRLPENVSLLPSDEPTSIPVPGTDAIVHGQSYSQQAESRNLAEGYPAPVSGAFNIGLLHTNIGEHPEHGNYAACSLTQLREAGYEYWALGHVHNTNILSADPWIVYPGNIQGRHIRETGPKGCRIVHVENNRVVTCEHRDLDVLRWEHLTVDATDVATAMNVCNHVIDEGVDVLSRIDERFLALRVDINGTTDAHEDLIGHSDQWRNEILAGLNNAGAGRVWVEKIRIRTERTHDLSTIEEGDHAIGELLRFIRDTSEDGNELEAMARTFKDLDSKLPAEMKDAVDGIRLTDPDFLLESLDSVRDMLLNRIHRGVTR
jgi:DNA repair protein SbcD/Mre11